MEFTEQKHIKWKHAYLYNYNLIFSLNIILKTSDLSILNKLYSFKKTCPLFGVGGGAGGGSTPLPLKLFFSQDVKKKKKFNRY